MSKEKRKILLVEDDKFISRICKNGLERSGFDVIIAFNGIEAFKKAKQHNPDLILLDLIMPFKDGFEVLAEMRMDKKLKDIPVIVMTNLGQESDIIKGKELGVVDYLVKSDFKIKEVVEKVKHHLARSKIS